MTKRNQKTVRNTNEVKQAQEAAIAAARAEERTGGAAEDTDNDPGIVETVSESAVPNVEALVVGEHGLIIACAQIDAGIQTNKLKLGDIMLGMAQSFCDEETGEFNLVGFEQKCADEEKFIKSDAAGPNKTNRIPRTWTQYKSDIVKGAANFKLNPADFQTISAHKKEITKQRRASKGGSTGQPSASLKGDPEYMALVVVSVDLFEKQSDESRDEAIKEMKALIAWQRKDVAENPRQVVKDKGVGAEEGLLDDLEGAEDADLTPEERAELAILAQQDHAARH